MRKIVTCVLVVFAAMLGSAVPAHATATTAATFEYLSAVSCVNTKFCVAVGIGPVGPKKTLGATSLFWNGASWRRVAMKQPSGTHAYYMESVSCRSAAYCVTIGSYGLEPGVLSFAETWSGGAWTLAVLPKPAGAVATFIAGASCGATRNCMAAGFSENAKGHQQPLVETLAGSKWTIRNPSLPAGTVAGTLSTVSCPSAGYCALAGEYSTATASQSLFESWNGSAFTRMKVSSAPAGSPSASGESCASAKGCAAVGQSTATYDGFTQVWNGKAWSVAPVTWPKGTAYSALTSVSCAAAGRCAAAGSVSSKSNPVGVRAVAVGYNGKAWASTGFPAPPRGDLSNLAGISCPSVSYCVAVGWVRPASGSRPSALTSAWSGKSWKLVTAP